MDRSLTEQLDQICEKVDNLDRLPVRGPNAHRPPGARRARGTPPPTPISVLEGVHEPHPGLEAQDRSSPAADLQGIETIDAELDPSDPELGQEAVTAAPPVPALVVAAAAAQMAGATPEMLLALDELAEPAAIPATAVVDERSGRALLDRKEFERTLSLVAGTVDLSMFRTPALSLTQVRRAQRRRRLLLTVAVGALAVAMVASLVVAAARLSSLEAGIATSAPVTAPEPTGVAPRSPAVALGAPAVRASDLLESPPAATPMVAPADVPMVPDPVTPAARHQPGATADQRSFAGYIATDTAAAVASAPARSALECDDVACLAEGTMCCPGVTWAPAASPAGVMAASSADALAADAVASPRPARPDRAGIMRTLAIAQAQLVRCASDEGARGVITLDLAIGARGELEAVETDNGDGRIEACVAGVLSGDVFPVSQAGARISYPIVAP